MKIEELTKAIVERLEARENPFDVELVSETALTALYESHKRMAKQVEINRKLCADLIDRLDALVAEFNSFLSTKKLWN